MLTLNLNSKVEQELDTLALLRNESIERIITDALKLYAKEQKDTARLAVIKNREYGGVMANYVASVQC